MHRRDFLRAGTVLGTLAAFPALAATDKQALTWAPESKFTFESEPWPWLRVRPWTPPEPQADLEYPEIEYLCGYCGVRPNAPQEEYFAERRRIHEAHEHAWRIFQRGFWEYLMQQEGKMKVIEGGLQPFIRAHEHTGRAFVDIDGLRNHCVVQYFSEMLRSSGEHLAQHVIEHGAQWCEPPGIYFERQAFQLHITTHLFTGVVVVLDAANKHLILVD